MMKNCCYCCYEHKSGFQCHCHHKEDMILYKLISDLEKEQDECLCHIEAGSCIHEGIAIAIALIDSRIAFSKEWNYLADEPKA
jgi:hypothetical protein